MSPLFPKLSLRKSFGCSALVFVALLCSGLHARIAQYHPYSAFRSTSIVLIEPDEKPSSSMSQAHSQVSRCGCLSPMVLLLAAFASRVKVSLRYPARQLKRSSPPSFPLVPSSLFVRPPPSLPRAAS
jgi:hypothetical protein